MSTTRVCPSVPLVAQAWIAPPAPRDRQQPRAGRRGLREHQQPEVLGPDVPAPDVVPVREREQPVVGDRERMNVHAVGSNASHFEHRVERPQRRGEAVADVRRSPAGDRVQLIDAELVVMRVGDPGERRDRRGQTARRAALQELRDRRVAWRRGLHEATRELIAVDGDGPDAGMHAQVPAESGQPGEAADRRPRERHVRQRADHAAPVSEVALEVVSCRPAVDHPAAGRAVPAKLRVQLRFVAELQRAEPRACERSGERAGLDACDGAAVGLEVDAQSQLRARLIGERPQDPQPVASDRVGGASRPPDSARRPPAPVGAIAADPERGHAAERDVAKQPDEHGVDVRGIVPQVALQRVKLDREPEVAGRDRRPDRGRGDHEAHRAGWAGRRGLAGPAERRGDEQDHADETHERRNPRREPDQRRESGRQKARRATGRPAHGAQSGWFCLRPSLAFREWVHKLTSRPRTVQRVPRSSRPVASRSGCSR